MVQKANIHILLPALLFFLTGLHLDAQFYNGHQMTFGKNRVQYDDFYWYFYRYDKYDVYFNQNGKALAQYTADYLREEIHRVENFFDYTLEKRLIFIVYNKLTDYRQSNIGLITGKEDYNTGGATRILRNKVFVYFQGDHKELEEQITASVTEILINEMIYGNDLRQNVANSTLINLPDWYLKGLISYVARGWDFELENHVKDGILSGRYVRFNRLTGQDAIYAGHSFWRFIGENYGKSVIPNIIYLTRINKNSNSGFLYVLGLNIKELSREWQAYYKNLFEEPDTERNLPETGKILKKTRPKKVYEQIRISPGDRHIAFVTNESGKYKIWLYDSQTGKKKKIYRKGHRLDQIPDYTYPVLAWHPTGRILTFITEEEGQLRLNYYTLENREITSINLLHFEKVLDFRYSEDGFKLVLSGVVEGQTDIYVHNIAAGTNEKITDDIYDDHHPRFVNDSKQILFTSNRPADSAFAFVDGEPLYSKYFTYDMYLADYDREPGKPPRIRKVSDEGCDNDIQPYETERNEFTYLSDRNGIFNRFVAQYDSTISFIDTVTHYRYFTESYPVTNYSRNILGQDINPETGTYGEIIYHDGRYKLFQGELVKRENAFQGDFVKTEFRKEHSEMLARQDSLRQMEEEVIHIENIRDNRLITGNQDTLRLGSDKIEINNYVFEQEKLNYYNEKLSGDNVNVNVVLDTNTLIRPYIRIYETSFYINHIVNQIDFNFLNESYQPFTGGAVYYNPGFNMLFKLGTNDLFEDYKIVGGVRFSSDFDSNEYLLSFENLKKRLDRQIIFHRQAFKNLAANALVKTHSNQILFSLRWPFNQVTSLKTTLSGRYDRNVFLSTDLKNLNEDNYNRYWAGLKFEYIFDNTRDLGLNLYHGTRYKIFSEAYKQVNGVRDNLFVVGADFRNYIRIHRTLIWANRFAASASYGSARLIYYLGSVDNWTKLNPRVETFDRSIPVDYSKNYAYQTLATNMRGFTQNIRNGDRFSVFNSEIRWPVIRYFANHPISSNFWNNLQLVGFFDIGTAWSGPHPYAKENAYDTEILESGPITVTIDTNRDPIVAGYGAGIRAMLLGYFVRFDWAWGIENNVILPRIFYFSLSLDF